MKICHLTSVHAPFDTRIFHKEAKALAAAGHRVIIIAQHDRRETIDGIEIIPLPKPGNRCERMTVTTFKLLAAALREHADVYHFHDPELLPVGLFLKLFTKSHVVYDVHEDYPELILEKVWLKGSFVKKLISAFVNGFEHFSAMFFDRIVVVTSDMAKRFPPKKTAVVRNFVSLDFMDGIESVPHEGDRAIVIYMGNLERNRGIKEIIQAMELVGDKAELWLLGKWDTPALKEECENTPGWHRTHYFGHKKLHEAYRYLKAADIGLHCVYPNEYYLQGLPTKMFEYAACGVPAVLSYSEYWEELFGDFVLFADPRDPGDIAEKISRLVD